MRRRPRHKKPLQRMLRKCRQPPNSLSGRKRQVRTRISRRRGIRAIRTPTRLTHSTRAKVWGKARAANRASAPQPGRAQAKVKIKSGTHPNLIARAQAPDRATAEKESEMRQEREKVETNPGT